MPTQTVHIIVALRHGGRSPKSNGYTVEFYSSAQQQIPQNSMILLYSFAGIIYKNDYREHNVCYLHSYPKDRGSPAELHLK